MPRPFDHRYAAPRNEGRPCWNSPDSVSLTSLLSLRHNGIEPLTKPQKIALGGNSGGNFQAIKSSKMAYLLASQAEFGCALGHQYLFKNNPNNSIAL